MEPRQPRPLLPLGTLGSAPRVGGVDLKAAEEQDWSPDTCLCPGIDVGRARPADGASRCWQLLGEFYRRADPP